MTRPSLDLFGSPTEPKIDRLMRLYRAHPRKFERRLKEERTRLLKAELRTRRRSR